MKTIYDVTAPKKSANLSINSDLLQQAKDLGIVLSAEMEHRLIELIREHKYRQWEAEVREDIEAYNAAVRKHGVFSDGLRGF